LKAQSPRVTRSTRCQFHQYFTCAFFWRKDNCAAFFYLCFGLVERILAKKALLYEKCLRKMLINLTSALSREHWSGEVLADKWVSIFPVYNWPLLLWKNILSFKKWPIQLVHICSLQFPVRLVFHALSAQVLVSISLWW